MPRGFVITNCAFLVFAAPALIAAPPPPPGARASPTPVPMIIFSWDQEAGVDGWNIYLGYSLNDRGLRVNGKLMKERRLVIADRKYGLWHGRDYYLRRASVAGGMEIHETKPIKVTAYHGGINPKEYTKTLTPTPKPEPTKVIIKKIEAPKLEVKPRPTPVPIKKIKKKKPTRTYTPKPRPTRKPKATRTYTPKPKPTRKPKPTKTYTPKPKPTAKPTSTPLPPTPTLSPTPAVAAPKITQKQGKIPIAWRTQAGVEGWNIYVSKDKKFKNAKLANKKLVKDPEFVVRHSMLVPGKYYYVWIVTVKGGKQSKMGKPNRLLAAPDI